MASIDKIYFTKEEGRKYWMWLLDHDSDCKELTGKLPSEHFYETDEGYVSNNPEAVDWYLFHNCPFEFIKARIKEQYGEIHPINKLDEVWDILQQLEETHGFDKVQSFLDGLSDKDIFKAVW